MRSWMGLGLSLLLGVTSQAATWWCSPNGTGNGQSLSTPFRISDYWSHAGSGDVVNLLDGTYYAPDTIQPPANLSGTSSQPITIQAYNDGTVLIVGGGLPWGRRPLQFDPGGGNNWFIIQGMNLTGGPGAFSVAGSHNIVRRVVGYGRSPYGAATVGAWGTFNLIEDCAFFGESRKIISSAASGGAFAGNVWRRCWARWETNPPGGPSVTVEQGYGQGNTIFENIVATWTGHGEAANAEGLFYEFAAPDFAGHGAPPPGMYGSIAYQLDPETCPGYMFHLGTKHPDYPPLTQNYTAKELVAYTPLNNPKMGFEADADYSHPKAWFNNHIVDCVSIGGGDWIGTDMWYVDDADGNGRAVAEGATLADVVPPGATIFDFVPGIGYRYVNGVRTTTPLWPWPMDQRIRDAMDYSNQHYGTNYTLFYVTDVIESIFGQIPPQYRSDGGGGARYNLAVTSNVPSVAVASSSGHGGTANYDVIAVPSGTSVNLQAPAADPAGYTFSKWKINGVEQTAGWKSVTFALSGITTAVAVYSGEPSKRAWWTLNETNGTSAHDAVSNFDGIVTGGAAWSSGGQISGALDFDGQNDYVSCGDPTSGPTLDVADGQDLTMSFWVCRDAFSVRQPLLYKKDGFDRGNPGYGVEFAADGTIKACFSDGTVGFTLTGFKEIGATGWHHVVVVFDQDAATRCRIYLDGADVTCTRYATTGEGACPLTNLGSLSNSRPLCMACESDGEVFSNVKLDDVRLYGAALTALQVADLYSGGAGSTTTTAAPTTTTTLPPAPHPADTGVDWRISISELTLYGSAWKTGLTWPTPPSPIDIQYVTKAASLWKAGEVYQYERGPAPPACWIP